jgi:hypothetical protein
VNGRFSRWEQNVTIYLGLEAVVTHTT